MHQLWDYFYLYPWLALPWSMLTLWMFIEAHRRESESYWPWVVLFFQPLGVPIYFFLRYLPSLRVFHRRNTFSREPYWQKKQSLDALRHRADRSPTVVNRLAYAQRLMEKRQHAEAIPQLEAALAMDENYCLALHELALCLLAEKQPERAIGLLQRLLNRDRRWSDYRALRTMIEAQLAVDRPDLALAACRDLEKMVPTLQNKCMLAEHLLDNHLHDEAVRLLDLALEDHAFLPLSKRWRHWTWARRAKALLLEAETKK